MGYSKVESPSIIVEEKESSSVSQVVASHHVSQIPPDASSDIQIVEDAKNSQPVSENRPKILIVDDEAFNVQVLSLTLKTTMSLKEKEDYEEAFDGQ